MMKPLPVRRPLTSRDPAVGFVPLGRFRSFSRVLVAACCILYAGRCLADAASSGDSFHISGFGTVGISQIDEPDGWAYTRNLNQANNTSRLRADLDSRLGVQFNYKSGNQLEWVGQVVASRLSPDASVGDAVELAFAAYRPDANWTLRFGRVNLDAFALSDHRDVGFAYEFVRPPVEFYSQTPTSLDGLDVSRVWTLADAQWRAKVFGGRTGAGTGDNRLVLKPLLGMMISRESDGLLMRVSALRTRADNSITALKPLIDGLRSLDALPVAQVVAQANALANGLDEAGSSISYLAGGVQYDRHGWLLSGELGVARLTSHPASSYTAGYGSIGRRLGPVSIFAVESVAERSADTTALPDWATPLAPLGPVVAQQAQLLAAAATLATNSLAGRQHTLSFGARWDLQAQLALKAQWDYIRTQANAGSLWGDSTSAAGGAHVVTVVLDFVF